MDLRIDLITQISKKGIAKIITTGFSNIFTRGLLRESLKELLRDLLRDLLKDLLIYLEGYC